MSITKGKWEAVENDHFIDIKVGGNPIAQVVVNTYADVDKEQMRVNARMMAASKEMLRELESILNSPYTNVEQFDLDRIEEIVSKVKGEL